MAQPGKDTARWLLDAGEPAARWVTLTGVLDRDASDPAVRLAHEDVVGAAGAADLRPAAVRPPARPAA